MLLTKEVEVRPTGKMIQYYKDKGYDAYHLKPIMVKIEDLSEKSNVYVDVLCDYCNNEILHIKYVTYRRGIGNINKYACKNCSQKKLEDVLYALYGVKNSSQVSNASEKKIKTCIEKYGVVHHSMTNEYKEKFKSTMLERYGVDNAMKSNVFLKKSEQSCLEKYGTLHPSQSKEIKEKIKNTCLEKYGYDNPLKSPEIWDKIRHTNNLKYGVNTPFESKEIQNKIAQSFYANSSQKASKQQRYICNLYQGVLNYPVKYYNVDIYLSDDNLIIEYDGGFHMGNVITGRETQEEFDQKEIVRNNVIKNEGYKQMRIISSKDFLPSDSILLQMLEHAKQYFLDYPSHSWIEFNIDTSSVRNAEHKDGVFYDYGELRRIKKSDTSDVDCA